MDIIFSSGHFQISYLPNEGYYYSSFQQCFFYTPTTELVQAYRLKCIGLNSNGKQCKNPPRLGIHYCLLHDPNLFVHKHGRGCIWPPKQDHSGYYIFKISPKCKGLNRLGKPCMLSSENNSNYCPFHQNR